ncbi:hypothetical protein DICPUDRAFT_96591 [Dictyostelium purpureum]|uniref:Uncharacterized protein n=1 Tax=Dictyostelium purpureum TaxID=5786 RepID=F0Z9R4_DICPU|nr:uncharacterized protein DICPUDRAFT_96591 [Dictyostelium purpureum]EGC39254.1 hypothetical protein DICPUDRAFT_96591 [Dictyostelium purpureum]|eukprot:XP_003284158.1 hypothetical protein DICPUDRAFT_96591 [Dictyostelium purpureum]
MKDSIVIPTVNLANLSNINKSPTSSNPCSPHTKIMVSTPYEFDGCMLCVNGTPSCLQKRRATWTLKLRVALYCLSVLHPEKKYFNLKKDIYTYVDSHWDHLSINTAKSDRWRKQVQDSLSHCRHFESGWDAMGCNGHWRLIQPLNPWALPPDKEGSIYDDEESSGGICLTPEAGLSPRTTKSPREDPLYRNFPKRRPTQTAQQHQQQQQQSVNNDSEEIENRKRKANDEERFTEEELLLLKYSPMIFSDTPSPKCRTPRGNNPASISSANSSTTSPSIIGNSPLLTAAGVHFSLSNFNNNLNLNGPIHTPPQQSINNNSSINNITILDNGNSSPPYSSPSLQSNSNTTHSPPIPANPFSPWKNNGGSNSNNVNSAGNSPSKSPSLFGSNGIEDFKVCPLPNPFGGNNYKVNSQTTPGFTVSNNSSLKVPSELLKSSIINNHLTQQAAAAQQQQASQQPNNNSPSNNPPTSPRTGEKLTKLQQQNLILNCTY